MDTKPLASLSSEEKRRRRGEFEEMVSAMGDENELKGVRAVQEKAREQDLELAKQLDIDIETLKKFSGNQQKYQRYLLTVLNRFVAEETIPKKYELLAESTDTGIVVGIGGTDLQAAFKTSGIPIYDLHACKVLAVQTGNTVAKLEGHVHMTDSGIIIPDQFDQQQLKKNARGS